MTKSKRYIEVAVSGPAKRTFSYHLPPGMPMPQLGQRLLVPFGRSRKVGFLIGESQAQAGIETKPIAGPLDDTTWFAEDLFKLCLWMADYYFANPADCLIAALPSAIRNAQSPEYIWRDYAPATLPDSVTHLAKAGNRISAVQVRRIKEVGKSNLRRLINEGAIEESWIGNSPEPAKKLVGYRLTVESIDESFAPAGKLKEFSGYVDRASLTELGWTDHYLRKGIDRGIIDPVHEARDISILDFVTERPEVAEHQLTEEQETVVGSVAAKMGEGFSTTLLHGVTGSGKTLVYCHLARKVIKSGGTILVLTPEIALSGATLAYFRGFFDDRVTIIHSSMTERERLASWLGVREGKYQVVIGPRSALFAPLESLGLIIVDEEHDASYKQNDPSPRFHGRDAAIMRGRIAGVPVLLGTATPSIESYYNAELGRYDLLQLKERPANATLPNVPLIDMKEHRVGGEMTFFSLPLKKRISERLQSEQQVILYLNRRGYAPYLKCQKCGEVPGCPRCNIKLTYHRSGRKLTCHYCDFHQFGPGECQNCQSTDFDYVGTGTQKVEESLPKLIKEAKVARFDSDTASGRNRSYRILRDFAAGKQNVLLGTQMVTKGLDLSRVTLVGVLAADFELDLPDFRASERTFARLVQVAGRSGRREEKGEVLIQTFNSELPVINEAARQDYDRFFKREIESRREYSYPPFSRLVRLIFSGPESDELERLVKSFSARLEQACARSRLQVTRLGPSPCPLSFLRGRHRRHLILKTGQVQKLVRLLSHWEIAEPRFGLPARVRVTVDVDPVDLL